MLIIFQQPKKGTTSFNFLSYEQLKPVQRVFFIGLLVAMETDYFKIIEKTYLGIIRLSNDTILLSLSVTEWFNNSIKRQRFWTVEK